jgi:hypothetical protein
MLHMAVKGSQIRKIRAWCQSGRVGVECNHFVECDYGVHDHVGSRAHRVAIRFSCLLRTVDCSLEWHVNGYMGIRSEYSLAKP